MCLLGPGSYEPPNPWSKITSPKRSTSSSHAHPAAQHDPSSYVQVATAPSIPARSQSYGYEEGVSGELIMQRPPSVGHTGKHDDTVAPGEYNPKDRLVRKLVHGTDFARGSNRPDISKVTVAKNPGPGLSSPLYIYINTWHYLSYLFLTASVHPMLHRRHHR